jgi:hypothetical protein
VNILNIKRETFTDTELETILDTAKKAGLDEWRANANIDFPSEPGYSVYLAPSNGGDFGSGGDVGWATTKYEAAHIASADPVTVARLVSELRQARDVVIAVAEVASGLGDKEPAAEALLKALEIPEIAAAKKRWANLHNVQPPF